MLRQLYSEIAESTQTSYKVRGTFITPKNGERVEETTLDLILITISSKEIIQIGTFPDHTRVGYMGEKTDIVTRLKKLNLPSTPKNTGDTVFYQLRRLAEQQHFGPIYVEQQIEPNTETELVKNLRTIVNTF